MSPSKNPRSQKSAFVLTEVLVAVSILAVGLVFILSCEIRLLRTQRSIVSLQEATLLMQRHLWEMNHFDVGNRAVADFNIVLKRLSNEDELFQKREVEVTWKEREQQKRIAIETYRLLGQ